MISQKTVLSSLRLRRKTFGFSKFHLIFKNLAFLANCCQSGKSLFHSPKLFFLLVASHFLFLKEFLCLIPFCVGIRFIFVLASEPLLTQQCWLLILFVCALVDRQICAIIIMCHNVRYCLYSLNSYTLPRLRKRTIFYIQSVITIIRDIFT